MALRRPFWGIRSTDIVGEVSYKGHRYPAEIIAHCVWLYHRFPLSFREVRSSWWSAA